MTIMLGKYAEFNPGFDIKHKRRPLLKHHTRGQKVIAEYLKKGELVLAKAGKDEDVFTHERIPDEAGLRTDGKYSWNANLHYYVEKYNLKLPKEFEKKVLDY